MLFVPRAIENPQMQSACKA